MCALTEYGLGNSIEAKGRGGGSHTTEPQASVSVVSELQSKSCAAEAVTLEGHKRSQEPNITGKR